MGLMKWLDGSNRSEANRWVKGLVDPVKRQRAEGELLRLGAHAAPALIDALRSRTPNLGAQAEKLLVRIGPDATAALAA